MTSLSMMVPSHSLLSSPAAQENHTREQGTNVMSGSESCLSLPSITNNSVPIWRVCYLQMGIIQVRSWLAEIQLPILTCLQDCSLEWVAA